MMMDKFDSRKKTTNTKHDIARGSIRNAIAQKFLESIEVIRVDKLPNPVYAFDPDGWEIYCISGRFYGCTCEGDYWGYHPQSGEIRHLIMRRCWWGAKAVFE